MKVISFVSLLELLEGFSSKRCTLVRRGVLAFRAYLSLARCESPMYGSPQIVSISPRTFGEVAAQLVVMEIMSELGS